MGMAYADYSRCTITHPDGTIPRARFIFFNGNAAVWVEDKANRSAQRILFATGATFERAAKARFAHLVHLPDDGTWEIHQQQGGCGCGSTLKRYTPAQLTDPNVSSF